MQMLQERVGVPLLRVEGHVTSKQCVQVDGKPREVNSYHHYGAFESYSPLEVWAKADDGVVKAVRHSMDRTVGIMWHPERMHPFSLADIELFRDVFGA
jgi:putative glutamine amidotransferase